MGARGANVLGEDLVGLSADDFRAACDKTGDTGDPIAACLLPIGVDGVCENAVVEHRPRLFYGQPDGLRNLEKHFLIGEVTAFDKIGFVQGVVNLLETGLRICPFGEFLREAAVVRVRAPVVRKMFGVHQAFHARVHGVQIQAAAGEQFLQRKTFRRSVRMEGKVPPLNLNGVIPLQSLNTPGTEIAPGSNEVREYFQLYSFSHRGTSNPSRVLGGDQANKIRQLVKRYNSSRRSGIR